MFSTQILKSWPSSLRVLHLAAFLTLGLMLSVLQASAQDRPLSFADLAEAVQPAVVNITTKITAQASFPNNRRPQIPQLPPGSPFEELFRDFFEDGPNQPRRGAALGSGFIVSADGYLVTNNHVIDGADEIEVELFSGEFYDASLVGADPKIDIAVLKIESEEPLPFVTFGDSDIARVGDWVMAIGNPFGQGFSVSTGIISARNRELQGAFDDYLQTDTAINRGNSGGPLFDLSGNVIGVNTAIISPTGASAGLGFSMASNVVSPIVDQLIEFGSPQRGWLGVRIQPMDEETAEILGLDEPRGALISAVPEGPARDAGIEARDVILSVDDQEVADARSLVQIIGNSPVGATVDVTVFRDGDTKVIEVTLGLRSEGEAALEPAASAPEDEPLKLEKPGLILSPITPEIRERLDLNEAVTGIVIMGVEPNSSAEEKGLRAGDVILEVGPNKVSQPKELEAAMAAARDAGRKSVLLLILRDGTPRFVALSVGDGS